MTEEMQAEAQVEETQVEETQVEATQVEATQVEATDTSLELGSQLLDDTPEASPEATSEEVSETISFLQDEQLRADKSLSTFKDADSLAKSYVHLNKLLSKRMGELSPEEANELYGKLGVPASPEEYSFPDALPKERSDFIKSVVHKWGIPADKARGAVEEILQHDIDEYNNIQQEKEQMNLERAKEIKAAFGSALKERMHAAREVARIYGGEEFAKFVKEKEIENHPTLIKFIAAVGKELVEDSMMASEARSTFGVTPEEANSQIAQKMSDKNFLDKYQSNDMRVREQAIKEIQELYQLKNAT